MRTRKDMEKSLVAPSQAGDEEIEVSLDHMKGKNQIDEDQLRAMNARRRVAMWTNNCVMDDDMIATLQHGIYGKGNASHHKFRTVEKQKFTS